MCIMTFDWKENDSIKKFNIFKERRAITWATIDLTDTCSNRCVYCYNNSQPRYKPNHMEKKKAIKLIDLLADAGLKQITCSGGEPLMYPHIEKFIRHASDHGMIIHMISNGNSLTEKLANNLQKAGLSQIQTNIESLDPLKHDYIRGCRGSWERAVNSIKIARKAGLTPASNTIVTSINENEIVDIFKFVIEELDVTRSRVIDLVPSGGRGAESASILLPQNYFGCLEKLIEFAEKRGIVNIETCDPVFSFTRKINMPFSGTFCVNSSGLLMNIRPNGDVYFCATLQNHLYNIFDIVEAGHDIREFHENTMKDYVNRKNSELLPENCRDCGLFNKCLGGCFSRAEFTKPKGDFMCPKLST